MADQQWLSLTVIPAYGEMELGRLHEQTLQKPRDRMARILRESTAEARIIGFVDFTLNSHATGRFEPHWQLHAPALSTPLADNEISEIRRRLGPEARTGGSRLRVLPAHFPAGAVAYLSKLSLQERVSPAEKRQHPEYRKLPPTDEEAIFACLQQYTAEQRMFLIRM